MESNETEIPCIGDLLVDSGGDDAPVIALEFDIEFENDAILLKNVKVCQGSNKKP